MANVTLISDPTGFSVPPQQVLWDRIGGTPLGTQINETAPLRNRPRLYAANGLPVVINSVGPVARLRLNGMTVDVNFAAGEPCVAAKYPPGSSLPDNTPIMVEFQAPLGGVGAYLSILGDPTLYDGRPLHAVMWVLLDTEPDWKLAFGDGVTGPHLPIGSVPTTAFVGAEAPAGARITKVCFDASLAGNFDSLILSRLYWVP